jgi:hypothetical protein
MPSVVGPKDLGSRGLMVDRLAFIILMLLGTARYV